MSKAWTEVKSSGGEKVNCMHKMEKLLLCQAVATEPEDRQVSCVCTYYIWWGEKAEVSHLTFSGCFYCPLGDSSKRSRVTTSSRLFSGLALPGPDRWLKEKEKEWGRMDNKKKKMGWGRKRHTAAHLLMSSKQQWCCPRDTSRRCRQSETLECCLPYQYRFSQVLSCFSFSGRTNVYINIQDVQWRQEALVWEP